MTPCSGDRDRPGSPVMLSGRIRAPGQEAATASGAALLVQSVVSGGNSAG